MMEKYFRRAMLLSRGDATVFLTRPISATILAIAALGLLMAIAPSLRAKRREIFVKED